MKQLVLPPGSRSGDQVELRGKEHHYLSNVRRIAVGEKVTALDNQRQLFLEAVVVAHDFVRLRILDETADREPTGPRLVLFPFLLKGGKLDDVVRQACEAGVWTIVPVQGDHCIARLDARDAAKKSERWSLIAKEAAQQSGNPRVCDVQPPVTSRELFSRWLGSGPLFFFHQTPLDTGGLHRYLLPRPNAVGLIVGPEGGLSEAEVAFFREQGALPVWLGPFVLRAETASIYAMAAVNTILQEGSEWTIRT